VLQLLLCAQTDLMKSPICLIVVTFLSCSTAFAAKKEALAPTRILAVFAHPDDETVVTPALAKLIAEGHTVDLVIVTSGQKGVQFANGIPAGPMLGKTREAELKCAGEKLGLHETTALGYQDQGLSDLALLDKIGAQLRDKVDAFKPDIIITWGPEGMSGHPDHRLTGIITSQVFFERYRLKHHPRKLYYPVLPESQSAHEPDAKRHQNRRVADVFVTTNVKVEAKHVAVSNASYNCHVTQLSPEMKAEIAPGTEKPTTIFFRLAAADTGAKPGAKERTLFDGLDRPAQK
jgi:LmbE family N-acetylglucosaminyl deacetylase